MCHLLVVVEIVGLLIPIGLKAKFHPDRSQVYLNYQTLNCARGTHIEQRSFTLQKLLEYSICVCFGPSFEGGGFSFSLL